MADVGHEGERADRAIAAFEAHVATLKAELAGAETRAAAVDEFVSSPALRERISASLKPVGDLERLAARAGHGHATARDRFEKRIRDRRTP